MNHRYKAYQNSLFYFTAILGSSLLVATHSSAADYYWDQNGDGTAGFGSATGTTWSSAGTGNKWSTSPTGDGVGGAAVADYVTTSSDDVYFGTVALPMSGNVAISGTVNANKITLTNAGFATSGQTFNFSNAGTLERAVNDNGAMPASTTFTFDGSSATSSIRWKPRRNFNVTNVTHSASKVILSTADDTDHVYPGRTVIGSSGSFGAAGAELVFDDGQIRLATGFPYTTLADLNTDHPITWTPDKDAGFENLASGLTTFTLNLDVDLGTGAMWLQGNSGRDIVLTATGSTWGKTHLAGGIVEVSESANLGPISAPVHFGAGAAELGASTLRITGTTFSSFGARTLLVTDDNDPGFEIVEANHTFTIDQALTHTTGDLIKTGAGTLVLSGATNTYTGATSASAGTLALVGGSHASPITVSSGASLGFTIGSATTSSASVDLTNGTVAISNPGSVDGSTSYLLMTSAGFTFTDPLTQLGTAVPDYELELQAGDTELWLVPAAGGFDAWAGGAVFTDDDNGDGVTNGVAFLLGAADPGEIATDRLPTISEDGLGGLVLTFNCLPTADRGTSILNVEHSSDLGISDAWAPAVVPDADGVDNGVSFVVDTVSEAPLNKVTATIGVAEAGGTGKLFGHLKAENP